jgi:pre-rRNA-processing protein RIX1
MRIDNSYSRFNMMYVLRNTVQRLTTQRPEDLPQIIPDFQESLRLCSKALAGQQLQDERGIDLTSHVHKYKTHISTLLQDRNPNSRWAAVVLIKATVEAVVHDGDGWDFLLSIRPWVQSLVDLLAV